MFYKEVKMHSACFSCSLHLKDTRPHLSLTKRRRNNSKRKQDGVKNESKQTVCSSPQDSVKARCRGRGGRRRCTNTAREEEVQNTTEDFMKRWHELERFKHLYEAQRRTGRRPDEGEGKGGGPSERSPLVVTGQSFHDGAFRATSDIQQIELSRYLILKVSHRSHPLSPAAITQIREHTRKKISLQYVLRRLCADQKIKSKYLLTPRGRRRRRSRKKKIHNCIFLWKTAAGTDSLCHSLIISSRVNPADGNLKPNRSISLFNEM